MHSCLYPCMHVSMCMYCMCACVCPCLLRPAGGPIFELSRLESGRNPARKPVYRPGGTIVLHKVNKWDTRSRPPILSRNETALPDQLKSFRAGCTCSSGGSGLPPGAGMRVPPTGSLGRKGPLNDGGRKSPLHNGGTRGLMRPQSPLFIGFPR
jgi:hypothetical protein